MELPVKQYRISESTEHFSNIKDWLPSESVLHHCSHMGLECLKTLANHDVSSCYGLVNAVLEYYKEDGKFEINNDVTLVYGLQDLFYITGLPISGSPVIATKPDNETELFATLFGSAFAENERAEILRNGLITIENRKKGVKTGVLISWLKEHFEDVGNKIGEPTSAEHVRAYMLHLIHYYIIPETNTGTISTKYLPLIQDVSKIREYAWGAASLANTYSELSRIKPSVTKKFQGLIYPLALFFFGRIPSLLGRISNWPYEHESELESQLNKFKPKISCTFPLMSGWMELTARRVNGRGLFDKFQNELKSLKSEDVTWQPYNQLVIPSGYGTKHKIMEACRIPMICFHIMKYNRPDFSPRQFGKESFDVLGELVNLKCRTEQESRAVKDLLLATGTSNRTFNYAEVVELWKHPQDCYLLGVGDDGDEDSSEVYFDVSCNSGRADAENNSETNFDAIERGTVNGPNDSNGKVEMIGISFEDSSDTGRASDRVMDQYHEDETRDEILGHVQIPFEESIRGRANDDQLMDKNSENEAPGVSDSLDGESNHTSAEGESIVLRHLKRAKLYLRDLLF